MHPFANEAIYSPAPLFFFKKYRNPFLQGEGLQVYQQSVGMYAAPVAYMKHLYCLLTKIYSIMVKNYKQLPVFISIFRIAKTPITKFKAANQHFSLQL